LASGQPRPSANFDRIRLPIIQSEHDIRLIVHRHQCVDAGPPEGVLRVNIDQHILKVLATGPAGRPVTIGDLAREFGVSAVVVLPAARRLVGDGLATASMVDVRGVPTLRGLMALPSADRPA
jgi:hypothetical protein